VEIYKFDAEIDGIYKICGNMGL